MDLDIIIYNASYRTYTLREGALFELIRLWLLS